MQDPYESLLGEPSEVTSEVTAPKKRGRPKKAQSVTVAIPEGDSGLDNAPGDGGSVIEPPTPARVQVVIPEKEVPPIVPVQSISAQTLAELEAGRRQLAKYKR